METAEALFLASRSAAASSSAVNVKPSYSKAESPSSSLTFVYGGSTRAAGGTGEGLAAEAAAMSLPVSFSSPDSKAVRPAAELGMSTPSPVPSLGLSFGSFSPQDVYLATGAGPPLRSYPEAATKLPGLPVSFPPGTAKPAPPLGYGAGHKTGYSADVAAGGIDGSVVTAAGHGGGPAASAPLSTWQMLLMGGSGAAKQEPAGSWAPAERAHHTPAASATPPLHALPPQQEQQQEQVDVDYDDFDDLLATLMS